MKRTVKRIGGLLAALLILAPAAPAAAADAVGQRGTLKHDGLTRSYFLHLPTQARSGKPAPLLLVLHGGGGRARAFAGFTKFNAVADAKGFAVVYPQGVGGHWNDGRTRIGFRAHADNIDDTGFLKALVAKLVAAHKLDRARVYVTGMSNGGMMAMRLACEAADTVAAIAAVAANFPIRMRYRCAPSRPLPVLIMNGTNDPMMPWRGGEIRVGFKRLGKVLSTKATAAYWAEKNGCDAAPASERLPDKAPADGTEVRRTIYAECAEGGRVVLYTIDRGGHTWPGGLQYLPEPAIGKVSRDIVAQQEIWRFFESLRRR